MEPYKLRRWRRTSSLDPVSLFTCARPGRSKGASGKVPDTIVDEWVKGLPDRDNLTIVSLLGRKHGPSGMSEFSFYSFYGKADTLNEKQGQQSFQEWLNEHCGEMALQVIEFPTYDFNKVPEQTLIDCTATINDRLSQGHTVILVDSGGETRTRAVCKYMKMIEDPARLPRK